MPGLRPPAPPEAVLRSRVAYYEDLSPCGYFGAEHAQVLRAVGWLESGQPIPTGEVGEAVFSRLCELLAEPWQPAIAMGVHPCQFCRFTGGLGGVGWRNTSVHIGSASLFLPARG